MKRQTLIILKQSSFPPQHKTFLYVKTLKDKLLMSKQVFHYLVSTFYRQFILNKKVYIFKNFT